MATTQTDTDQLSINAIRALSIDMVQAANSGHPGAPLGIAPVVYLLWNRIMRHNPKDPRWVNRDRFILSAGHASAVQYAALYMAGYGVSLDDLKRFRQWGSPTAGHPEYGAIPGVEVSTGPLGQGFAMGVGMGIAEQFLAAKYNRPKLSVVDNFIYSICSDGDLMEGVSHEAGSLAGTLGLGNLIYIFDSNHISIDGGTAITFVEDVAARFKAYGWHVQDGIDANDIVGLENAIKAAQSERSKPSLIIQNSRIGFGSPVENSSEAHGKPLGDDAVKETKTKLGYPSLEPFHVPHQALSHTRKSLERGQKLQSDWNQLFDRYAKEHPDLAKEFKTLVIEGRLPGGWDANLPEFPTDKALATREASGQLIQQLAKTLPTLMGGSADLASSTNTMMKDAGDFSADNKSGRNVWFGVREHAMGSIANGMALYGGTTPFTGTFLIFSDYMRPALRLGALMGAPVVNIFTHDSIGLGEDGPTHQPVEHLPSLRAIPNYHVIRPADANETREAWRAAILRRDGPTALILTRQKLPTLDRTGLGGPEGLHKGAYVLWESGPSPELVLIASGSEVSLTLAAGKQLAASRTNVRVVSMPCWELFEAQSQEYRDSVLPPKVTARLAVEAAAPLGWERWVGSHGDTVSVTTFGHSAPGNVLFEKYGFTVDNVIARAKAVLKRSQ
ncbi:MAG: transketolase [Chloroflexi bacterium]|nr:transketolase [Chloroflexota bacterium]